MAIKIDTILSSLNDFPTLPTIYSKLMTSISNPRSTVNDVAEIIIKDQATTVKLLKLVNSPIFGIRNRVNNVTQAIFLLGFNEVKNLVLSLSILELFKNADDKGSKYTIALWKHTIAVATFTKILGNNLGVKDTENYFVSGIVHDIGVLFFLYKFSDLYSSLIDKSIEQNLSLDVLEKETFGMSRNVIGGLIAEKWKLPINLKNVIQYANIGIIDGKADELISCVHLADIIAKIMDLHYIPNPVVPIPNFQIWNKLTFDNNILKNQYQLFLDSYQASSNIIKLAK